MRPLFLLILSTMSLSALHAQQMIPKVVGGYDVQETLYPWQVALYVQRQGRYSLCGGSLISPQWVLTAAHCLQKKGENIPPQQVKVYWGGVLQSALKPAPAVNQVYVHPDYDSSVYSTDDIALLHLQKRLPLLQNQIMMLSAPKNTWEEQDGAIFKVSGWGALKEKTQDEKVELPDHLQIVALPLLKENTSACRSHFQQEKQLCVGDLAGGRDSCQGDSGGALFRGGIADTAPIQYGVVSYGEGCARKGEAAVYTRISHYIPWIKETMAGDASSLKVVNESAATLPPLPKLPRGDRALLIGVGHYYLSALTDLKGPPNDVENMRDFLIQNLGFKHDQIYSLIGQQATSFNIRKLVKKWLIEQTGTGDRVWLYFSGHGLYYPDTNGDEKEVDTQVGIAVDETILPYDTDILTGLLTPVRGNMPITSGHILDDEINQWLQQMEGREVSVVFDSCHSGTATRSASFKKEKSGITSLLAALPKTRDVKISPTYPSYTPQQEIVNNSLDNYVTFWSAVKSSEIAQDGTLSIFTKAFIAGAKGRADSDGDGKITYAELLKFVRAQTRPYHMTPQLEIAPFKLGYSFLTGKPIASVSDAISDAMSNDNPSGLKLTILDAQDNVVTSPPYCSHKPCPKYHLRVSTEKGGWLLLYFLHDSGKGSQALPNSQWPKSYSDVFKDGETRNFPFTFEMNDPTPTPGVILGILLDAAEEDNYQKIEKQFANNEQFDALTLHRVIEQRDNVLLGDGQLAPVSTVTIPLLQ